MKSLITTLFLFLHSSECLFQGSEEVVDVLRADAEAHGGGSDVLFGEFLG